MSRRGQIVLENFLRGLSDTMPERGLELPGLAVAQDVRFGRNTGLRRNGMVRVAATTTRDQAALDFSGTGQYLSVPVGPVHTLGTTLTWECLFTTGSITGTHNLFGWNHGTDVPIRAYLQDATLRAYFRDSANNASDFVVGTLSVDTTYHLRLVRDGDTLYAYLDGTLAATSSIPSGALRTLEVPGGSMQIAANAALDPWDGTIDYQRCFSRLFTDFAYAYQRWPHSKGRYVLWDYWMQLDADNQLVDQSTHLNTGTRTGTPTSVATLAVRCAPGQGLIGFKDRQNQARLAVVNGGVPFTVAI